MTTAFQPGAFQSDGFQIEGGVLGGAITVNINGTQQGDSGLLTVNVVGADVTPGWPIYLRRRKRVSRETQPETVEQLQARIEAAQEQIRKRQELRKAEQRSQEITAQLRAIFAEQDYLAMTLEQRKQAIAAQQQEDEDIALILTLAS